MYRVYDFDCPSYDNGRPLPALIFSSRRTRAVEAQPHETNRAIATNAIACTERVQTLPGWLPSTAYS